MVERRFRDMRLTEEEVLAKLDRKCWHKPWWFPGVDVSAEEWKLYDRAKRLLPIWREWGLRELAGGSYDKPVLGAAQRIISIMNSRKDR